MEKFFLNHGMICSLYGFLSLCMFCYCWNYWLQSQDKYISRRLIDGILLSYIAICGWWSAHIFISNIHILDQIYAQKLIVSPIFSLLLGSWRLKSILVFFWTIYFCYLNTQECGLTHLISYTLNLYWLLSSLFPVLGWNEGMKCSP